MPGGPDEEVAELAIELGHQGLYYKFISLIENNLHSKSLTGG